MQARAPGSPLRLPPQPQPQPQPHPHPQPQPQIQLQLHLQPLPPPLPPPPPIPSSRLLRRFPVTWPWNMKGFDVVPGTLGSLALRFAQFSAAVVSFAVMISVRDFSTVTAFCFLVAATVLQCLWSLSVAAFEGYAWVLGRSLQDSPLLSLFAVGDWITSIVVFAGACASASIAVLVSRDLRKGCVEVYCGRYAAATGMAFLSWFLILISFLYTFWNLARR